MRIYLLADRAALLVNDGRPAVTILPENKGTLYVEGESFEIENGSPVPVVDKESGYCRAKFVDEQGITYKVNRPTLKDGAPYTVADYATGYISLLLKMDSLERENDRLTAEFRELAAATEPDALGHLNIGGTEK